MKVLFSDMPIESSGKILFLAGPTSRENDYDTSWRKDAVKILDELGFEGTVCVPEFSNKRPFLPDDWEKQVNWEWRLLDAADCIVFWVPRSEELPGLTTNLEFGTYFERCPDIVVLGYPSNAEHMEWMRLKYTETLDENPRTTLEQTLKKAIEICEDQT